MNWRVNLTSSLTPPALCILLAGAFLAWGLPAEAKTRKATKKTNPAESPAPAEEKSVEKAFDIPIPINHSAQGVRIPIYTDGKLQMMFESEIAFRVDTQQLRLSQLRIATYDDAGQAEMSIDMPLSIYNLKSKVLTSVDPVTIRRTDLEVMGGNMTFDTQTRQGKFTGPVRMLIYQNDEPAKPSTEVAP